MAFSEKPAYEYLLFLRQALDQHAIVSATDVSGTIIHANDQLCDISGYSRSELLGSNHRILKSEEHDSDFFKSLWKTIANGKVWQGSIKNRKKQGNYYWVKTTIVPLLDEHGKPLEYIGIRTDITEQVESKQELKRAYEMLEKARYAHSNFLSAMSHDIRTPLNAIIGFSEMINQKFFGDIDNEIYEGYLKDIEDSGIELLTLINEVFDVSEIERARLDIEDNFGNDRCDPVALSRVVARALAPRAISKGIKIKMSASDRAPMSIKSEKKTTEKFLNNLISYVLRHAPPDSTVSVHWDKEGQGDISLLVENQGKGFSSEIIETFTDLIALPDALRANGSKSSDGFGLYICKRYIASQGGKLGIGNKPEGGAYIKATWPADVHDTIFIH